MGCSFLGCWKREWTGEIQEDNWSTLRADNLLAVANLSYGRPVFY